MTRHALPLCCLVALLWAGSPAADAGAVTPPPDNGPLEQSLLGAATKGDVRAVGDLLDRGARIDAVDPVDGATPLLKAVGNDDSTTAGLLVDRGANLEAVNAIGYTPLQFAAGLEYTGLAKMLAAKGADVNSRAGKVPALVHAANTANLELVDFLLAKGADPNLAAADGSTALMWASARGSGDIVGSLLKRGAKVDTVAADGRTALSEAVASDHADVAAQLTAAGARPAPAR